MYIVLVSLVLGLFAAVLFVNFYFRWKVLKVYQHLRANRVEFNAEHIFSRKKLRKEILPRYPEHADDIETFVSYLHHSVKIASILIVLITMFGSILMYYSKHAS